MKNILTSFFSKRSNALHANKVQFQNKSLLSRRILQDLRIFATTVIRGSTNRTITGLLFEIDWLNKRIRQQIPIPLETHHPFWNARGGNRGGRGVFVHNGILYVASAMSILMFNRKLKKIGELTHPYLAGLHEIWVDSEGIWLTSTVHDLVIKLNLDGDIIDEWWGSESQTLQQMFGFSGRAHNLELNFPEESFFSDYEQYCKDIRLHANTVFMHNNYVYVLANRIKSFIRIRPKPLHVIIRDNQLESAHNGIITQDNRILINNTKRQSIRIYNLLSGKHITTLSTSIYGEGIEPKQFAQAGWQRGLTHVKDSIYLVGTSPASLFEVDINKGMIGQVFIIDTDVRHCIHGLTATTDF